jgi:hypothetical protein
MTAVRLNSTNMVVFLLSVVVVSFFSPGAKEASVSARLSCGDVMRRLGP